MAKLSVFSAAVDQRQYVLALIGMLAAAIAAYVYLRIVLAMYAPADDDAQPAATVRARVDFGTRAALTIAAAAVLFLGIMPGGMLDFAKHATQLLTH